MKSSLVIVLFLAAGIAGGWYIIKQNHPQIGNFKLKDVLQISSPVIPNNGIIPDKYTCSGLNLSPELNFWSVPSEAKSLALIMEDTDAPSGSYIHWVIYNMPPSTTRIAEAGNPPGTVARNGNNVRAYTGPCPPTGEHRYHFTLYALDEILSDGSIYGKADLAVAMKGHILDHAEMVGRYKKK